MQAGTRLGHYEILEPVGAGGMGEVDLGQDSRLGRQVAIKVLPAEFASDPGAWLVSSLRRGLPRR